MNPRIDRRESYPQNFKGQVAVVTGAGRGIGAATARALAREGAKVALLSRNQAELLTTVGQIEAETGPGCTLALPTDVAQEDQVQAAFQSVLATFGPCTILINNAAVFAAGRIEDMPLSLWEEVMAVNLRGTFLCTRQAFLHMKTAGGGSIVNISSLGGVRSTLKFPGFSAYTASKAGVVGFTEALSVEGQEYGIRVNCVAPGAVNTRMLKQAAPFLKAKAEPEDLAEVILFLADAKKSHTVTGAVLEVNSNA